MVGKQWLLLVDEHDTFLGKYEEKEVCHTCDGIHHRAFVVLLYDKEGKVLLQKRRHKRWDKYWDLTAISHVLHLSDHDETYEEAAHRALKVEMGIDSVTLKNMKGFNYFARYGKQCENEYCAILIGEYTGEVQANPQVVYEYVWMDEKSFINDAIGNSGKYTPWAVETAKILGRGTVDDRK